jgi:hypothetical protein
MIPAWAAVVALVGCGGEGAGRHAFPVPGERGPRVVVEVLNASGRTGLARSATRVLRRAGIDVVYFGNAPGGAERRDSTRILLRRGEVSAARRVREALGVGTIVEAQDPELLLDVSVVLGGDFAPPGELHP